MRRVEAQTARDVLRASPAMRVAWSRITLLILDVDGVLTDGGIYLGGDGVEFKRFDVKDGFGISQWRRAGGVVALLTGRRGEAVEARAVELSIDAVVQGSRDKGADAIALCQRFGVDCTAAMMVGDDLPDLPAFAVCGCAVAVADAAPEVKAAAQVVTSARGGHGAVREVIEALLFAQDSPAAVLGVSDGSAS